MTPLRPDRDVAADHRPSPGVARRPRLPRAIVGGRNETARAFEADERRPITGGIVKDAKPDVASLLLDGALQIGVGGIVLFDLPADPGVVVHGIDGEAGHLRLATPRQAAAFVGVDREFAL